MTRPTPTHTDVQRLGWADAYAQAIGDPAERANVEAMISAWQDGREATWPSFAAMTLPMRQVARILRGEARHVGAGVLEPIA
jgi:hypothetical protein